MVLLDTGHPLTLIGLEDTHALVGQGLELSSRTLEDHPIDQEVATLGPHTMEVLEQRLMLDGLTFVIGEGGPASLVQHQELFNGQFVLMERSIQHLGTGRIIVDVKPMERTPVYPVNLERIGDLTLDMHLTCGRSIESSHCGTSLSWYMVRTNLTF